MGGKLQCCALVFLPNEVPLSSKAVAVFLEERVVFPAFGQFLESGLAVMADENVSGANEAGPGLPQARAWGVMRSICGGRPAA